MKLFAKTTCMHALWVAVIWTELKNHPLSASRGKEGGNNPIDGPQHRRRVPTHHLPVVGGRWAAGGVAFVHAQHAHTHTHTSQFICSAVPCPCRVGAMWPYVAQMEAHWAEVRWLWVLWFLSPSLQAGIWPCFTPTALEQAPCQTQHWAHGANTWSHLHPHQDNVPMISFSLGSSQKMCLIKSTVIPSLVLAKQPAQATAQPCHSQESQRHTAPMPGYRSPSFTRDGTINQSKPSTQHFRYQENKCSVHINWIHQNLSWGIGRGESKACKARPAAEGRASQQHPCTKTAGCSIHSVLFKCSSLGTSIYLLRECVSLARL